MLRFDVEQQQPSWKIINDEKGREERVEAKRDVYIYIYLYI